MFKSSIFLITLSLLGLTGCDGSHIYIEEAVQFEDSYYGNELAGRNYLASYVELGIGSGNIYSVDPGSLQVFFDSSANFVSGNKNCNAFQATPIWYEYSLAFSFTYSENSFCPIDLIGFPEGVFLDDVFEVEIYFELGLQTVVLHSENQDVSIYLN